MSVTVTSTKLDFTLITEIGQHGKNSKVFTAHDVQLNCEIVVKKIEKSKIKNTVKFFEEGRRLNDSEHQHVVPIKFATEDSDHIYLGMPYYAKGSLKDLIDSRFLTVREIIRYSIQFLSGLNHIHVNKLIHFDIKPDNILLSNANEAQVADFGLARNIDLLGLTEIDDAYLKHVPPEYFTTSKHSMLFDIYSAGLTLYRLCNGNKVFYDQFNSYLDRSERKTAIINAQFPNRKSFKFHIPKKLRSIIKKSLEVKPENRYQTALEFINDLSDVCDLLDWQYTENGSIQSWRREDDDKIIQITLTKLSDSKYDLVTAKTIKASGKTTRITEACIKAIIESDVEKVVFKVLTNND